MNLQVKSDSKRKRNKRSRQNPKIQLKSQVQSNQVKIQSSLLQPQNAILNPTTAQYKQKGIQQGGHQSNQSGELSIVDQYQLPIQRQANYNSKKDKKAQKMKAKAQIKAKEQIKRARLQKEHIQQQSFQSESIQVRQSPSVSPSVRPVKQAKKQQEQNANIMGKIGNVFKSIALTTLWMVNL